MGKNVARIDILLLILGLILKIMALFFCFVFVFLLQASSYNATTLSSRCRECYNEA